MQPCKHPKYLAFQIRPNIFGFKYLQGSCYRTYFDSKHFTSAYNVFEIALKLFQCAKTIWMKKQNYINSKYENSRCTSVHIHLAAIHYVPSCFGAASIDKIYIHCVIYMIKPLPSKSYKRNSIYTYIYVNLWTYLNLSK